jgi:hypothetical protein
MTYTLWIPRWKPVLLNRLLRLHWSARQHALAVDAQMVWAYARATEIPRATTPRRISLHFILAGRQQECDPDATLKSLLDACVKCGILVDDSPRWVQLGSVTSERGCQWGTRITLEDLSVKSST